MWTTPFLSVLLLYRISDGSDVAEMAHERVNCTNLVDKECSECRYASASPRA